MPNMTLSIPEELHKKMKQMSEIRWSEVARKAIEQKTKEIISEEEKETSNWAVRLQRSSRSGRLEQLKKRGLI